MHSADNERPRHYLGKIQKALAVLEAASPVPVDLSDFDTFDGTVIHTVRAGDTLASIARQFDCCQVEALVVAAPHHPSQAREGGEHIPGAGATRARVGSTYPEREPIARSAPIVSRAPIRRRKRGYILMPDQSDTGAHVSAAMATAVC
eukprot:2772001-Pyramimonas_sp.AAC.1